MLLNNYLILHKPKYTIYEHFRLYFIPSLTTFGTYIGPNHIFIRLYLWVKLSKFDKIRECILIQLLLEGYIFSLIMHFKTYTFGQIKTTKIVLKYNVW